METQAVWSQYNSEMYFFILKKVKDRTVADDILQNAFLKIHKNLPQLKDHSKIRAWVFQIVRNEIANYFNGKIDYIEQTDNQESTSDEYRHVCCFDKFINELPEGYKQVIDLVFIKGEKQKDAASLLGISLENVKIRIKRAKDMLKNDFAKCCQYKFDQSGNLIGEPNCPICEAQALHT